MTHAPTEMMWTVRVGGFEEYSSERLYDPSEYRVDLDRLEAAIRARADNAA